MHFALPPRKSSNPPPYARGSRWSPMDAANSLKRQRTLGVAVFCASLLVFFVFLRMVSTGTNVSAAIPAGTPEVIIVTLIDDKISPSYLSRIKHNRDDYASRYGYKTWYGHAKDFDVGTAPKTWTLLPAIRKAMNEYPHSTYFWSLSPHAVIMNPTQSLVERVMEPKKLESLMIKDYPVVPPDSVIHTFSHLKGDKVDFVLTQDKEGLCHESMIFRRGDWANFFLDVWLDPLYRTYNFQKAEAHALEHIVQWHPTILTKLALIPIRVINSYTAEIASRGGEPTTIKEGDFVARAVGCEKDANRHCENEMEPWYNKWRKEYTEQQLHGQL